MFEERYQEGGGIRVVYRTGPDLVGRNVRFLELILHPEIIKYLQEKHINFQEDFTMPEHDLKQTRRMCV